MTPRTNSAGIEGQEWGHSPKSSELLPLFLLFLSHTGVPTILSQHLSGPCIQEGHSSARAAMVEKAAGKLCLPLEKEDLNTNVMVVLLVPLPGSFSHTWLWVMDTFNNTKFIEESMPSAKIKVTNFPLSQCTVDLVGVPIIIIFLFIKTYAG